MRHSEPFGSAPSPSRTGRIATIISLIVLVAGLGLGLYGLYSARIIGRVLFAAAMIALAAVAAAACIAGNLRRQPESDTLPGPMEVPPPPDVYAVWSPTSSPGDEQVKR